MNQHWIMVITEVDQGDQAQQKCQKSDGTLTMIFGLDCRDQAELEQRYSGSQCIMDAEDGR